MAAAGFKPAVDGVFDPKEIIIRHDDYVELRSPDKLWGYAPGFNLDKDVPWDFFVATLAKYPNKEFLGTRSYDMATSKYGEYTWKTYSEVAKDVAELSGMFAHLGINQNDCVALFANNSEHWILTDFACERRGAILVPLYHTYGIPALAFIIKQITARVVVCAHESFANLLDCIKCCREENKGTASSDDTTTTTTTSSEGELCTVKTIIMIPPINGPKQNEEIPKKLLERAERYGIRVIPWAEALREGSQHPVDPTPTTPDDLNAIVYTSGTSGMPKGVMVSHRAIVATTENICSHYDIGEYTSNVHYSYLPLAHVYERCFEFVMTFGGGSIGFFSGSPSRLMDDMKTLKPTFVIGVPRVWKRVHDKVMETVNGSWFFKRWLFNFAYAAKSSAQAAETSTWVDWDSVVFSNVKSQLGGRVRWIGSASAPMPAELISWLDRVFCVDLVMMYGLTEAVGGVSASQYYHPTQKLRQDPLSTGHVCRNVVARLIDVPELGYSTKDELPKGEVIIKGANVALGYYRDPKLTAESWDEDGWFHTGDIGMINADGSLSLIDRKKNMFKLAQGEYVPAEFLETCFSHSSLVTQIMVHGVSTEAFVVALIVPSFEALSKCSDLSDAARTLATECGPDGKQGEEPYKTKAEQLCAMPEVNAAIMKALATIAEDAKLPHFQVPKRVILVTGPWNVDNELVTPTMKLRRPQVIKRYGEMLNNAIKETAAQVERRPPPPKPQQ